MNLPTELVSSEYLTMSGSKFSTSRKTVIYVTDFLKEFGPDALRYYIAVAGPENSDSDFTWDEFVRRNNTELANEWGNLVSRSISMAHKNVGAIPTAGDLLPADRELLSAIQGGFGTVGDLLGKNRFKNSITEVMRLAGLTNRYLSETEPWKLKEDPVRRDTILHTVLQAVTDINTMMTPFLPHASQKVFESLGGSGVWAQQPEIRTVSEEGNSDYPVLTGDYAAEQATWAHRPIVPGTPLAKPTPPLFPKLDDSLGQTGPAWAPPSPSKEPIHEHLVRPGQSAHPAERGAGFHADLDAGDGTGGVHRRCLVVRMPVDGRTHQPYGILHGGASVALAETVASWGGALLTLDPKESLAVGMEINANHIRPASSGWVYATGTPISRGRTSQIWDIRIANEDGKLVCVSRCTMAIVPADRH